MKNSEMKSSPLYTYNQRTHTFSFKKKQNKRKFPIVLFVSLVLLTIVIVTLGIKIYNRNKAFILAEVPSYNGSPYVEINNNIPYFTDREKKLNEFEHYSKLDSLGRCGVAFANLSEGMMPNWDRDSLLAVTPTGWVNKRYDFIDGNYLYNRCHLIGFQLTGQGANPQNLITGTRYFNTEGMLPFENKVANYLWLSHNHVLYRITPYFEGNNLVASGVEMEGWSIEDNGENICFNVYIYNVQPGVVINYSNGESSLE